MRDIYAIGPQMVQSITFFNEEPTHLSLYLKRGETFTTLCSMMPLRDHASMMLTLGFNLAEGELLCGQIYDEVDYSIYVYSDMKTLSYHQKFSYKEKFPNEQDLADIFGIAQ